MKIIGLLILAAVTTVVAQAQGMIRPGVIWPDNNGVHVNAHGGGVLEHEGTYYWFGEHKVEGKAGNFAHVGVHVYSSKNLTQWMDKGVALAVSDDPDSDIARGSIIERPKVIYNATTKKFVMWFHLELKGQGYKAARSGVATADTVTGPYVYKASFRPNAKVWPLNYNPQKPDAAQQFLVRDFEHGQMARDMTLFVDDDGRAYHIYSSEENHTLHISLLSDNYEQAAGRYIRVEPMGDNEAPAIFKRDGKYYLFTSGLSGWSPNAARSFVADDLFGPWTSLGNPVRGTPEQMARTFGGQSTFTFPYKGKIIFMGDIWRPKNAIDGRYLWLPVEWEEGKPVLRWYDSWQLE